MFEKCSSRTIKGHADCLEERAAIPSFASTLASSQLAAVHAPSPKSIKVGSSN